MSQYRRQFRHIIGLNPGSVKAMRKKQKLLLTNLALDAKTFLWLHMKKEKSAYQLGFCFCLLPIAFNSPIALVQLQGPRVAYWLEHWTPDRKACVQYPMPPNTLRVHTEYVLVKSVGPKVPWAVAKGATGAEDWIMFSSPPVPCLNYGGRDRWCRHLSTASADSDVVQSGRPIFDDFFQHLWPYIGNNTVNVVFQMVKRLWLIRIDQRLYIAPQKIV
ncbi:hypothetical protein TNCV_3583861 [Trichonephila clavipes]|nr:hypothetical protein TNCV_3583861 [Trichonephila clavipes]